MCARVGGGRKQTRFKLVCAPYGSTHSPINNCIKSVMGQLFRRKLTPNKFENTIAKLVNVLVTDSQHHHLHRPPPCLRTNNVSFWNTTLYSRSAPDESMKRDTQAFDYSCSLTSTELRVGRMMSVLCWLTGGCVWSWFCGYNKCAHNWIPLTPTKQYLPTTSTTIICNVNIIHRLRLTFN